MIDDGVKAYADYNIELARDELEKSGEISNYAECIIDSAIAYRAAYLGMTIGTNQNLVVYKNGTHEFMHGLPIDNGEILAVFPCSASLKPLPENYFDEEEK